MRLMPSHATCHGAKDDVLACMIRSIHPHPCTLGGTRNAMTLPDWLQASSSRRSGDTFMHTTRATKGEAASASSRGCPCSPAHGDIRKVHYQASHDVTNLPPSV